MNAPAAPAAVDPSASLEDATQPAGSPALPLLASVAEDRTTLIVTGSERIGWLNGLVTCDLKKLGDRDGAYGLVVAKNGRIQADVAVVQQADRLLLSVPRSREEKLLAMFDTYLVMEDAEVAASADFAWIRVVGPGAAELGRTLQGAATLDWIGHGGAAIAVPREGLAASLAELSGRGVTPIDEATWALWCARLGVPRFGFDFDETTYPQEASLEKRAVSFNKGCYLGQEVVHTLEVRGRAAKRLLPVAIEGATEADAEALAGAPLTADGVPAGKITSVVLDRDAGQLVGLALAKVAAVGEGHTLSAGGFSARLR